MPRVKKTSEEVYPLLAQPFVAAPDVGEQIYRATTDGQNYDTLFHARWFQAVTPYAAGRVRLTLLGGGELLVYGTTQQLETVLAEVFNGKPRGADAGGLPAADIYTQNL